MLNLDRVRELVGDSTLSDEQAERIRDECRTLAELAWHAYHHQLSKKEQPQEQNKNSANDRA
jgi:hypothetical protein